MFSLLVVLIYSFKLVLPGSTSSLPQERTESHREIGVKFAVAPPVSKPLLACLPTRLTHALAKLVGVCLAERSLKRTKQRFRNALHNADRYRIMDGGGDNGEHAARSAAGRRPV